MKCFAFFLFVDRLTSTLIEKVRWAEKKYRPGPTGLQAVYAPSCSENQMEC